MLALRGISLVSAGAALVAFALGSATGGSALAGAAGAESVSNRAVPVSGEVFAWGANGSGELGIATTVEEGVPVGVLDGVNAVGTWSSIGAGGPFSCGIDPAGAAYCWGDNGDGQLGNGTEGTSDDSIPIAVAAGANTQASWTSIDGGWNFACGLGANALAYCWGDNGYGQIGNGTFRSPDDSLPRQVSAGANAQGTWSALSVGYSFACALAPDSSAYCWGDNAAGQLGNGVSNTSDDSVPRAVVPGDNLSGLWSSISAGSMHACGIAADGKGYCWGFNSSGQLGDGSNTHSDSPVEVDFPGTWMAIAAGEENSCGVSSTGQVYCWGGNGDGQLGQGSAGGSPALTPVLVPSIAGATDVELGQYHVCATTVTSVYCWGGNGDGQVGNGSPGADVPSPYQVDSPLFQGLVTRELSLGSDHTMVLMTAPTPDPPTPAVPSSAPRDVVASAQDAAATVTWRAPASAGSFAVSHYLATSSPGGRSCLVEVAALSCDVTGLANGTAYTFTVKALTGAGWSPASEPSDAVVPRAAAGPSVVITGSREGKRIAITGTTTGFGMGGELAPWVRLAGQSTFTKGAVSILVSMDGTFDWSRSTGKRASVYVATADGSTRSNTVTIPAR